MNQVAQSKRALPLRQITTVQELLVNDNAKKQLAAVAGKHFTPDRMMKLMSGAIRNTPKLAECDPMTLLGALMQCASLGLEPNTVLGHAYLIPFDRNRKVNNKWVKTKDVQLIVGYKGFATLARRSGIVRNLHADVVYDDDELWEYEYGSNMVLRHKPGPRQGKKTHAYCHLNLEDGGQAFVVLPAEQIIATRDQSQGWQSAVKYKKTDESPWTKHEDAMWSKTAVRALANRGEMPMSIEDRMAIEVDESPADFGAFAMNPDAPVTIEPEEGDIEGEVTEDDQPEQDTPQADAKTKAPATTKKQEDKPVEQESSRNASKPAKKKQDDAPEGEQGAMDLGGSNFKGLYETVLNDALEGGADAAMQFHAEDLDRMSAEEPKLHQQLMDELKAMGEA